MADPNEIEQEEDDKEALAALADGFSADVPPPKTVAKAEEEPKAAEPPKQEEPVAAAPRAEPKFAQITEEDLATLRAAAAKTATLEGQLSKAFGTMGNLKQVVDRLQTQAPAGVNVEIPPDAFAELEQDFPEVAAKIRSGIEKTLKGVKGGAPAPNIDAMGDVARAELVKREVDTLDETHPGWRQTIGAPQDSAHPFRAWLVKQPAEYQQRINSTYSSAVIGRAIDRFETEKKAAEAPPPATRPTAPRLVARNDRIRAAVQPRGDGGTPPPPRTDNDEFLDGWKTG